MSFPGWNPTSLALMTFLACLAPGAGADSGESSPWQSVAPGLDLGQFPVPAEFDPGGDTEFPAITIVRVDPAHWRFELRSSDPDAGRPNLSVRQWCQLTGLVAGINAGMFAADLLTHVGYLRDNDRVLSSHINHYQSVAAFIPRRSDLAPFRIFDLDEISLEEVAADYSCLVQNLRLIKRPGKNRWSAQERRWSEAALGEDAAGRVMMIFCRQAFSMFELNGILLGLPIDLVCAQHLEGGPEAQLYLRHGSTTIDLVGGFESGVNEVLDNRFAWPVPVVLGVVPRQPEVPSP